jgi:hypothetical protein
MTDRPASTPDRETGRYEIRLTGHLDAHWAAWFDGLTLSREADGTTVLSGSIPDQAALHGLLQRVRDLGVPLVSVVRLDPDGAGDPERPTEATSVDATGPGGSPMSTFSPR